MPEKVTQQDLTKLVKNRMAQELHRKRKAQQDGKTQPKRRIGTTKGQPPASSAADRPADDKISGPALNRRNGQQSGRTGFRNILNHFKHLGSGSAKIEQRDVREVKQRQQADIKHIPDGHQD